MKVMRKKVCEKVSSEGKYYGLVDRRTDRQIGRLMSDCIDNFAKIFKHPDNERETKTE